MKHETRLVTETSIIELSNKLAELRYDALSELMQLLSDRVGYDSRRDRQRGRTQLAVALEDASTYLKDASIEFRDAWKACEPHTEEE